jgi:allantoinase
VIGFKGFTSPMGDNPFTNVKPNQIKEALLLLKPYHAICAFHCEDYDMIRDMTEKALNEHKTTVKDFLDVHNVLAEYTATKKIIELSKETDSRVHICHVSHPMVAQLIKEAIMDNLKVTAETCPHYLCASQDLIYKLGAVAKCTPPLRTAKASEELWNYVIDGTLSCIGSDHSPATESEKDNSVNTIWTAWGGLNSIQYFLPIMFNAIYHHRKLSPQLITQTMSYNPAKIFGVHHKKGSFIVGHDGDLVILDPNKVWKIKNDTLFTKNKITAFNGFSGKGLPIYTIVRGEIIAENGMYKDKFGFGKIIKPQNNSPTL